MEKNDLELVLDFRQGKEAAFDELVRRYMIKAVGLASVMVGNQEDAKDVSQDAFVKIHRSLNQFQMQCKFSTWFYRVLANTAKDFLRKRRWTNFLKWRSPESMDSFFDSLKDEKASADRAVLADELRGKISRAVSRLPFKQQWVFTLRFVEGLSLAEIQEATGVAEGTVKATLHFAIQKFKADLLPYLEKGRDRS